MRHPLPSLVLCLGLAIGVSACTPAPEVPDMAPDEVLAKSAAASRTMQSATFGGTFDASFTVADPETTFALSGTIDGVFQDLGNDVSLTLKDGAFQGTSAATGPFTAALDASVTAFVPGDVYLRIDRLDATAGSELLSQETLTAILGKWWRLPTNDIATDTVAVTPDPSLLRAQSEVVRVTENKGVTMVEGHPSYHYAVTMDQEKLIAYLRSVAQEEGEVFNEAEVRAALAPTSIDGELLIDAETFFIRRISWDIERTGTEEEPGTAKIRFLMTIGNHNDAPEITPPANAEPFSPLLFLGGAGMGPLDPLPPLEEGQQDPFAPLENMTEEEQQQYILRLMEEGTVPFPVKQ